MMTFTEVPGSGKIPRAIRELAAGLKTIDRGSSRDTLIDKTTEGTFLRPQIRNPQLQGQSGSGNAVPVWG